MSEQGSAGERNLTGIWNGLYTYPHGHSTTFVATLIDAAGSLSGTTHEPSTLGDAPGTTLFAAIAGSRRDCAVTFTKRYDPPGPSTSSPVRYEGALNADGTEIEGRWIIAHVWSGKFLMIRSAGQETAVSRKALERLSS